VDADTDVPGAIERGAAGEQQREQDTVCHTAVRLEMSL
jgi:hypothetical protein